MLIPINLFICVQKMKKETNNYHPCHGFMEQNCMERTFQNSLCNSKHARHSLHTQLLLPLGRVCMHVPFMNGAWPSIYALARSGWRLAQSFPKQKIIRKVFFLICSTSKVKSRIGPFSENIVCPSSFSQLLFFISGKNPDNGTCIMSTLPPTMISFSFSKLTSINAIVDIPPFLSAYSESQLLGMQTVMRHEPPSSWNKSVSLVPWKLHALDATG